MINLNIFSQYRSALMGFSTVLILICHSIEYIGVNTGLMYHLLIQGNRGVDIFLFLSGIGIYYSLNRISPPISQKLPYWYAKVTIQRSNTIDNQPFGLIVSTMDWS